ncbi:ETFRF1 isoform 10, partial [Pan troglodytes]
MANSLRGEVLKLYKNLLYLGRDYPKGADYFKKRL